jgi:hypothetical protein
MTTRRHALMRATAICAAATSLSFVPTALAHSGGVSGPDCVGCHGGGDYPVDVTASPATFSPGETVTMTLTANGAGNVLGTFLAADTGSLSTIGGQGLVTVPQGLTHSSPKSMSGGSASFSFSFTAPSNPGAVRIDASTLAGNDDGKSSGDQGQRLFFDFVYGCSPQTYYRDFDGDGYGRDDSPRVHCAGSPPSGYAVDGGDCDDNAEKVYPGAQEVCNQVDDDCNGAVDDDAIPVELYPDADGDGYYGIEEYQSGETMMGCVPTEGWAAEGGDCKPEDPMVSPGQEEVCNLIDDDCDNKVDEKVRPRCGEGWCAAEGSNCDPISCFPGDPREETCNLFDDDCDGLVDNDAPCDEGLACIAGECREAPPEEASGASTADEGGGCAFGGGSDDWLLSLYLLALVALVRRRG